MNGKIAALDFSNYATFTAYCKESEGIERQTSAARNGRRNRGLLGCTVSAAVALAVAILAGTAVSAQTACIDTPCTVAGGSYQAVMPPTPGLAPMLVFLHGWGASPGTVLRDRGLLNAAARRGFAVIAPEGIPRPGRTQRDWAVRDGRQHPRDDIAFLRSVIADAAERFGLDRARVLLAGYSRGGSFVWDAACAAPDLATGFASIAGGFWDPVPTTCHAPVHLHHVHGFADTVVPLEGRVLRGAIAQADIFAGLALWRRALGCDRRATTRTISGAGWSKTWHHCTVGSVTLTLHARGHLVPAWWPRAVLDWFQTISGD